MPLGKALRPQAASRDPASAWRSPCGVVASSASVIRERAKRWLRSAVRSARTISAAAPPTSNAGTPASNDHQLRVWNQSSTNQAGNNDGDVTMADTLTISSVSGTIEVEVCSPVFFDEKGGRLNG